MKNRKFYITVSILAICAFGLVFMGCPPEGEDETTNYDMTGTYTFTKSGGNCTWFFTIGGNYECSGYGIIGTKTGTWSSKGNDITISYASATGGAISGNEVFTVQKNESQLTLTIKDNSIQLSNILVTFGLAARSVTLTKTGDAPITSINDLRKYLSGKPANTPGSPYIIKLNVDDISTLRTTLINASNKYVSLDFSGSTITTIPKSAFESCNSLTKITIPDSVTSIGSYAFWSCTNLTSVIFQGKISSFGNFVLPGKLSGWYETPGTYTRPNGSSETWTKQP